MDSGKLATGPRCPSRWQRWALSLGLTVAMVAIYHVNGDFLPGNDATPNLYLPINLLQGRGLSFRPEDMPQMFIWEIHPPGPPRPAEKPPAILPRRTVRLNHWNRSVDPRSWQWLQKLPSLPWTKPPTWQELRDAGWLRLVGLEYYLVPTCDPGRLGYVNQYGPGAGLTALPIFALLGWATADLQQHPAAVWYGGKFVASVCVAGSVGLVYLSLWRWTRPWAALAIALVYGIGTCVWSVSSQALWQSGPNILFLALAVYCLVQAERAVAVRGAGWWAVGAGLAAGWAVVCRPTSALVAGALAGAYLVRVFSGWRQKHSRQRSGRPGQAPAPEWQVSSQPSEPPAPPSQLKTSLPGAICVGFILGMLPPGLFLASYNTYYLGAPWRFGQLEAGGRLAQRQLGQPDPWSGKFLEGLYGQLISPSRGLFVYSPILVFSIWGMALAWQKRRYWLLRPLSLASLLLLLAQSKWFNWHGGWSFGYRLLVDTMPLAAVCAAPTVRWIRRHWPVAGLAVLLAGWSIGIQILGAFAYDVLSWNCREGLVVRLPDGRAIPVDSQQEAVALVRQTGGAVQRVYMDVDQRPWRWRLWSLRDNPIWYYLTHFRESRQRKRQLIQSVLQNP